MATGTHRSVVGRSSSPLRSSRLDVASATVAAPSGLRLTTARGGDHPLIHRLLLSVFHGPSPREFQAQLDEPGYDPAHRLVVKDGDAIAAHLRLARQHVHLERSVAAAARFMDLATAPEFRGRGLATALLAAGERQARERGCLIGITRTRVPSLFARQGWSLCGRHLFSVASPRSVLAELGATSAGVLSEPPQPVACLLTAPRHPVVVRPLRRIELPAIVRLYQQASEMRTGSPVRTEDYFEWLLARRACDRLYVAGEGGDATDLATIERSIVGYTFVRQGRIVELVTAPGRDDVARHLAARICADASEQDAWQVRCDLPASHPLHALWQQAGGTQTCEQQLSGEVFMSRLFDRLAAVRLMADTLAARAAPALSKGKPIALGIELRASTPPVQGKPRAIARGVVDRFCLEFAGRKVEVSTGVPSRDALVLLESDFTPLLLGDTTAEDLHIRGRLRYTSRTARDLASLLFGAATWWRPPLDDLLA